MCCCDNDTETVTINMAMHTSQNTLKDDDL